MAIKFKGKTLTGIPANGSISERELHINLADEDLYTSSDGNDVIRLTKERHGYIAESGTIDFTPDMLSNDYFDYTLTKDAELAMPMNFKDGNTGTIIIRQDTTGGHVLAFNHNYIFGADTPTVFFDDISIFDYKVVDAKIYMEFVASFMKP